MNQTACSFFRLIVAVLFVILGIAQTQTLYAQNYAFRVPELKMEVYVQPDGSARVVYDITFVNEANAHPIDIVDIGLPHADYNLSTVTARIDDTRLDRILKSEVVVPGYEVHLGKKTILPGQSATLHTEYSIPKMVYQDTTNKSLASMQITPTWFGSQFVRGTGTVQILIHLPPGIKPEEVLYQDVPFTNRTLFGKDKPEHHALVFWQFENTKIAGPHRVGLSFPKRVMTRVITMSSFQLLVKWFEESPQVRLTALVIYTIAFSVVFFRFTGLTGFSVYFVLLAAQGFWFFNSAAGQLIMMPVLAVLAGLSEWRLQTRRMKYLPAIAEIEGGGIKRGLTAPEAAVLLELPLGKVLSLVIFGLLKKRVLHVVKEAPLQVKVSKPFRTTEDIRGNKKSLTKFYRKAGKEQKSLVHHYEFAFLHLIEANPDKALEDIRFSYPIKKLIERVGRRMRGFDLSDTKSYYKSIVKRAMKMAETVGDIDQKQEQIDRSFEWLLMDDDYPTVFSDGDYHYHPRWHRAGGGNLWTATAAPTSTHTPGGRTSFTDVASSFAGWSENTMGSLASTIEPGNLPQGDMHSGILDLTGFDTVTGEILSELAKGGSGGGGGGGCACAGCACACACAGGGR